MPRGWKHPQRMMAQRSTTSAGYCSSICMALIISASVVAAATTPTSALPNDEWQLLWSDEFDDNNNNERSRPSDSFWNTRVGFLGFNGEFQTYTDSLENNVYVEDGKLHLAAQRDSTAQVGYTSGRINTLDKVRVQYATIEASIKIPDMKLGLWPAWWTMGHNYPYVGWPKAGEIDIMELGQGEGSSMGLGNHRVLSAMHWDAYGSYANEVGHLDVPQDLSLDFHKYKVVWQPDYITTYVDDIPIYQMKIDYCFHLWDCQEFHQYHYLILNVAVGGGFTCCDYGFDLNNYPNGTSWTMQVDYVRVYGNKYTKIMVANDDSTTAAGSTTAAPNHNNGQLDDMDIPTGTASAFSPSIINATANTTSLTEHASSMINKPGSTADDDDGIVVDNSTTATTVVPSKNSTAITTINSSTATSSSTLESRPSLRPTTMPTVSATEVVTTTALPMTYATGSPTEVEDMANGTTAQELPSPAAVPPQNMSLQSSPAISPTPVVVGSQLESLQDASSTNGNGTTTAFPSPLKTFAPTMQPTTSSPTSPSPTLRPTNSSTSSSLGAPMATESDAAGTNSGNEETLYLQGQSSGTQNKLRVAVSSLLLGWSLLLFW